MTNPPKPSPFVKIVLRWTCPSPYGTNFVGKCPDGKILKSDVGTAKNYLKKEKVEPLGRTVNAYLELAEDCAQRKIPMTMEEWASRQDSFLEFGDREILQAGGRISPSMG